MMISIAIPRTTGGGAEVFTRQFAIWLKSKGNLSKIYTAFGDDHFKDESVSLGELRAAGVFRSFWNKSSIDHAKSYLLTLGYINLSVCLLLNRKNTNVVIRLCNPPNEELKLLNTVQAIRYWLTTRISCAIADHIIVQSEHMKRSMLSTALASGKKISVINNPISDKTWEIRNTKRPFEFPYILCASSNKPQKDLPTLISAFANIQRMTDRHLVLAGVSADDPLILRSIADNKIEPGRVHCLGFVDDVFPLIEHAEVCTLPSLFEGFSNFLLEAAAYGKKIIATDCPGGNAELFSRYPNHKTVPIGDIKKLGTALLTERNDLVISQAKLLLEDFSEDQIYGKYFSLLSK